MTSGDMKIELNEKREISKTIPTTHLKNDLNPNSYDRNIEEISFEDQDEPEEIEDYELSKRFR